MKRHLTTGEWTEWNVKDQLHSHENVIKLMFRAEQAAFVYGSVDGTFDDEMLLATFVGDGEVTWTQSRAYVRVSSKGRVWFKTFSQMQTLHRMSDTKYTTLDRPAALSPEMQAVMRMLKHNENEREKLRNEQQRHRQYVDQRFGDRRSSVEGVGKSMAKTDVVDDGDKPEGSSSAAKKHSSSKGSDSAPELDASADKASQDGPHSSEGDEGGRKAADTVNS